MIITPRLILKPLTYSQVIKYLNQDNSLENELQLKKSNQKIPASLKEILEQNILPKLALKNNHFYFNTLWIMILTNANIIVGDLCFMDAPNLIGEIEIGYATYNKFRNKGLMTEAIAGMIQWSKKQSNVKSIFAKTALTNVASNAVLQKNNFIIINQNTAIINWRYKIK